MLQDQVAPRPFAEVELAVQRELGAPIAELFAEFEPEARAAASLAQARAPPAACACCGSAIRMCLCMLACGQELHASRLGGCRAWLSGQDCTIAVHDTGSCGMSCTRSRRPVQGCRVSCIPSLAEGRTCAVCGGNRLRCTRRGWRMGAKWRSRSSTRGWRRRSALTSARSPSWPPPPRAGSPTPSTLGAPATPPCALGPLEAHAKRAYGTMAAQMPLIMRCSFEASCCGLLQC